MFGNKENFIKFLKERGVYDEYVNEVIEQNFRRCDEYEYIKASFILKDTRKGYGYWMELYDLWMNTLSNLEA